MENTVDLKRQDGSLGLAMTGFVTLLVSNGLGRFGYPPLIPALVTAKWFTVAQADYLGAANLTGYIVGSMCGTLLNKYIGSVTLIRTMLLLTAVSFLLCAFPFAYPLYFFIRLIAGFAGGVIMVITAPTILKHTSPDRKGIIGGIMFSGVGIGIALAGTIIPFLVRQGLPSTWFTFGGLSFFLTLLIWRRWPEGSNEKHMPVPIKTPSGDKHSLWSGAVIFLMLSYACNAVGFVPHTVFWVDFISRGLHKGIEAGTHFWILLGLAAAIGPVLTGAIADKIGFARSIRISLLVKDRGCNITTDIGCYLEFILVKYICRKPCAWNKFTRCRKNWRNRWSRTSKTGLEPYDRCILHNACRYRLPSILYIFCSAILLIALSDRCSNVTRGEYFRLSFH
jgi:MFS family permease